jgi:hypothetical protein
MRVSIRFTSVTQTYSHDNSFLSPRAAYPDDARSVTRNLRNLPVGAPIRTKFIYCNMMFTVATYLVEKKSGMPFSDFLSRHFFRPLGMHSTNLQPQRARNMGLGDRIATGYSWDEESAGYRGFQSPDCPEAQGAGSIITSVNDYIKWVQAMMNHQGPISPKVYKGLVKSRILQNPDAEELRPLTSPTACGAGWDIFYYRGYMVVHHDGSIPGFGTCHFFLPEFKFGGVIFGNSSEGGSKVGAILLHELIDGVLKIPEVERLDWNKIESGYHMDNDEVTIEELRQQLCPGIKEPQPQTMPLSTYLGKYWNAGYHSLTMTIKNDKLYIDATDRSFGFTLTFEHICDQTKYVAHVTDYLEGGDVPFKAEFEFEKNKAVRMGLHLELDLGELIWFDRVEDHLEIVKP